MSLLDFLSDLANPSLAFLPRALLIAVLSSLVCGLVGAHVVLRGLSFVGDALSHAVFPGIAIAFALQGSILLGGAAAGILVAILISVFSQNRRVGEDSVIGVFFAAAFALGLVIVARTPGYTGSLESLLFGSLTGVTNTDVLISLGACVAIGIALAVFHDRIVLVSVDRDFAISTGLRVGRIDVLLHLAIATAVVVSIQTIGNVLVLALLVAPAATARLLTDRVVPMMLIGPAIGAVSAFLGIWASWSLDIPSGAAIVLVATLLFVLAQLLSPGRGLLLRARPAAQTTERTLA